MICKNNPNSSPTTGSMVGVAGSGSPAPKPSSHFDSLPNNISSMNYMQSLALPPKQMTTNVYNNSHNIHQQQHKLATNSSSPVQLARPTYTNNINHDVSLNKCVQNNCECDVYTPSTASSDLPKQSKNCSNCKHSWMLHCKLNSIPYSPLNV